MSETQAIQKCSRKIKKKVININLTISLLWKKIDMTENY